MSTLADPLLPPENPPTPQSVAGRPGLGRQAGGLEVSLRPKPVPAEDEGLVAAFNQARGEALPLARAADRDQFLRYFSCVNRDPEKNVKAKVSLWRFLSYSTVQERVLMIVGLLAATLGGCGIPAWLVLLAKTLDQLSNLQFLADVGSVDAIMDVINDELARLCTAFAVVGAVCLVAGTLYVSVWTYCGERQALRIRTLFVRASMNQDAAWFDKNDREALPTKMGTALVHINEAIGKTVVDVYANGVSSIGCLAVALWLNTPLALVMMCAIPVALLLMCCFNACVRGAVKKAGDEAGAAGGLATEALAGIKTVASMCAQPHFRQEYAHHVGEAARWNIRSALYSGILAGLTGALFYITYTVAFYVGTEQVVSGYDIMTVLQCLLERNDECRTSGASVMCCIYGVILSVTFFGLMGPHLSVLSQGQSAAVDVFDTLRRQPVIDPSLDAGKRIRAGLEGKITFKDLFFAYPSSPDRPIFYDFNLTIEPGQSVALVGPSGSGKSTIAKFLLRFYDPSAGDIIIDDKYSLASLNLSWWRAQIGYVAQEPVIFPGTVRENIAMGKPPSEGRPPTEEEIRAAAEMACAHEFILDLPDGYDTYYGGTSVQLSGGQMQRIAIARALIRNPKILVLDEATSALDQVSEEHVQLALANIRKKKKVTTVTIAHRLTTIMDSDAIAVISKGKIAELGNHEALMQNESGIYRSLCEAQGITLSGSTDAPVKDDAVDDSMAMSTVLEAGTPEKSMIQQAEEGMADDDLEAHPEEGFDESHAPKAKMSSIIPYLGYDSIYLIIGIIGSGIVGALSPCESILTAQIVATFYIVDADKMVHTNMPYIKEFLWFALASFLGNIMSRYGLSRSGRSFGAKLRTLAFSAMMTKKMAFFDLPENTTGELTTILGADVEAVEGLVGYPLGNRVRLLTSLITGISIAFAYSPEIGGIAITCVFFMLIAGALQVCCCAKKKTVQHTTGPSPATIMEQGLRGISSVQAYNLESKVADEYEEAVEPESSGKVKEGIIAGSVFGFSQMAIFVSFGIIFYAGAQLMIQGKADFYEFFTALLAVMFGALGAGSVSADFNSRQRGLISAARIFSTLDGPTEGSEDSVGDTLPIKGDIKFEASYFSYPSRPDFPIFYKSPERDGVNFSLSEKESMGLVGRSGSGKSTILQIIMRFYDITGGSAALDGTELSELNVNDLRNQVGYVGQLPTLFNGTVKDQLLLSKPDANIAEIMSACKAAQAHDFICDLANGYDTHVGPGGNLLSGGQKQRIAIARAIIRDPKILVLDEATAALDNESQKLVQATLDELQMTQPRTTLTVAHRLLTVKDCDKIAFFGEGGVLEIGRHSDLLDMKGHYYELWCKQSTED